MGLSYLLVTFIVVNCYLLLTSAAAAENTIVFDDSVFGRTFEGIGGISGGGATSKLLVSYPQDVRDQILDYLFLPNFGASLHILKVEIGGDIQSTDGTEASHMHNEWEENYERGYEWWMMLEAKKRNPNIKLYALPWGFPGWIGQGTPYQNVTVLADYVVRWINGAKTHYNLTIDYVGIWNEKAYNVQYIKTLRTILDQRGFQNVLIIAADGGWEISADIKKDADLAKIIHAIGCHYPGTISSANAQSTGLNLWASEDYSTYNDDVGAGCWARILNQNYVNGFMTSSISWDLIASYYHGLPYYRDGLMTAVEPWSGHYVVDNPIWVSAHTTQFTSIGWKYLNHTTGVGKLPNGGSYVGLVSPNGNDLTIIMETMTRNHSVCIRPGLPQYTVKPQTVTITLKGHLASITQMNIWYSQLKFNGEPSTMFVNKGVVKVVNGMFQMDLGLDEIFTLTTLTVGRKGSYPTPPVAKPFPLPYQDDFEGYKLYEEPKYLAQQTGSFEILKEQNNQFIRQMVLKPPLSWCAAENVNKAVNIIGNYTWTDIFIEVDFSFPDVNATNGIFVAARINQAGCDLSPSNGIYLFISSDFKFMLANDPHKIGVIATGILNGGKGWHKLSLVVQGLTAYAAYDGKALFNVVIPKYPPAGFVGIGTDNFGQADFDNIYIGSSQDGLAKMRSYFCDSFPQPLYFEKEHK